jgi:hypothetical protein
VRIVEGFILMFAGLGGVITDEIGGKAAYIEIKLTGISFA